MVTAKASMVPAQSKPILLVEDNADTQTALKVLLELYGYAVVIAGDGQDALDRLRGGLQPGVIVLDLMMARKDGFQFRAEQLADPQLAPIPVIIASGDGNVERKALALGVYAYVHKPIEIDEFLELIGRFYPAT